MIGHSHAAGLCLSQNDRKIVVLFPFIGSSMDGDVAKYRNQLERTVTGRLVQQQCTHLLRGVALKDGVYSQVIGEVIHLRTANAADLSSGSKQPWKFDRAFADSTLT